jgi:membrane protein required for colicin V production
MWIDIVWLMLMAIAASKGFKNGLILSLFSVAGLIIALAAALKLSVVVSDYIREAFQMPLFWLPIFSFIIVFIGVAALVRLLSGMLSKLMEVVLLGWLNKLGGFLLFAIVYTLIFSVFLFYADKTVHFSTEIKEKSYVYSYIAPWGTWTMDKIGIVLPWFKNVFTDLETFFSKMAVQISNK